jgi:hypothetical protein
MNDNPFRWGFYERRVFYYLEFNGFPIKILP